MPTRPSFELVRRGYEPSEVDAHIAALDTALAQLHSEVKTATLRATSLQRHIDVAGHAETSVESAFLAMADTKANMLEDARRKAAAIIEDAERKAVTLAQEPNEVLDRAWAEADAMLEGARREVGSAREEAASIIEGAHRKADVTITDARHEALRLLAEAKNEAEGVVGQAHADHETLLRRLRDLQQTVVGMLEHARTNNADARQTLAEEVKARVIELSAEVN